MSALPESITETPERTDRPLRVLCLNYEYPPMGGGAGNATHYTALGLASRGHTVHVLTSRLPAQPAVETMNGVVVRRVPSFRRSIMECGLLGAASYLLFALFELVRLARTYDYDVYQFHFALPTGLLALYVRFVLRKPYVLALRGSDVPGYDETHWFMRPLHCVLRPLTRYLWRQASAVTVLSEGLRTLARRTCPDVECLLIPNGVDAELFPYRPQGSHGGRLRLLTVCRMVRRKGLHHLIEAMRELRHEGVQLQLIGSGEEWDGINALIREHSLEDCVSLLGYVPRDRLHAYYQQADIFVLPSLSESFGQVLLEAMSSGLPIVATSAGGIPEVVRHNRNGLLIPPGDSAAIVEAVKHLRAHPRIREQIARRNAEHARERWSWSAVAARYEAVYFNVLGATVYHRIRVAGESAREPRLGAPREQERGVGGGRF